MAVNTIVLVDYAVPAFRICSTICFESIALFPEKPISGIFYRDTPALLIRKIIKIVFMDRVETPKNEPLDKGQLASLDKGQSNGFRRQ